jgi:peptide/nickel transport system substrate-binding protein
MSRRRIASILGLGLALSLAAAVGLTAASAGTAQTPQRGGELRIARIEDSQSFDKTNVFQNESLWLIQQINESLYTSTPDGKNVRPWLATGYSVSNGGKRYTFKLRRGVRFSNGQPMTAADVKFSIDDARAQSKGWGFLDAAIKNVQVRNQYTVVINLKYRWVPFIADIALFANGIIPKNFAGQ